MAKAKTGAADSGVFGGGGTAVAEAATGAGDVGFGPPLGGASAPGVVLTASNVAPAGGAKPKRTRAPRKGPAPTPLDRVSRTLKIQQDDLAGREVTADFTEDFQTLLIDYLRGLRALVDMRDQLGDPTSPPTADSPLGRVIALGKAQTRARRVL